MLLGADVLLTIGLLVPSIFETGRVHETANFLVFLTASLECSDFPFIFIGKRILVFDPASSFSLASMVVDSIDGGPFWTLAHSFSFSILRLTYIPFEPTLH